MAEGTRGGDGEDGTLGDKERIYEHRRQRFPFPFLSSFAFVYTDSSHLILLLSFLSFSPHLLRCSKVFFPRHIRIISMTICVAGLHTVYFLPFALRNFISSLKGKHGRDWLLESRRGNLGDRIFLKRRWKVCRLPRPAAKPSGC